MTKLGLLLSAAIIMSSGTAEAGFEFTPPKAPSAESAPRAAVDDGTVAIMPAESLAAAPVPDVAAEQAGLAQASPDAQMGEPDTAGNAPGGPASAEPVYIRRQRGMIPLKAGANEPVNSKALLEATEKRQPLALAPASAPARSTSMPVAQAAQPLAINPYPLETEATHGSGAGTATLEQAMMEEGGSLRPVAVPGRTGEGLRQRTRLTSRYDSESQYLPRTAGPLAAPSNSAVEMSSLTPLPGQSTAVESEKLPLPGDAVRTAGRDLSGRQVGDSDMSGQRAPMPLQPAGMTPRGPSDLKGTPGDDAKSAAAPAAAAMTASAQPPATQVPARTNNAGPSPAPAQAAAVSQMPRPAIPQSYRTVSSAQPAPADAGAPPAQFGDAVGFGRDLPLALALSQVVPPEYSYAFGKNINVGSIVSWQGGKPWNEVLNDMLAPAGMVSVIENNQVTIVNKG